MAGYRDIITRPIKVLVVDDSAFYRQSLVTLLEKSPMIEVVGIARDGLEAIRFLSSHKPDLITLDLEMPKLDGISFFRWLMKNKPIPSIVISSIEGGKNALMALDMGAVDFIAKPSSLATLEFLNIEDELFEKVALIAEITTEKLLMRAMMAPSESNVAFIAGNNAAAGEPGSMKIVTIGSSTGGPTAVQKVLSGLPENITFPILISQHMPSGFTKQFAERLDRLSQIRVEEARTGMHVEPGVAYICPGESHMELYQETSGVLYISLLKANAKQPYSPSIDIMMQSSAATFGKNNIGVILTGMGSDGLEGMRDIKKNGGFTIAEAEETALIYGMPKMVIDNQLADKALPLQFIGTEILKRAL